MLFRRKKLYNNKKFNEYLFDNKILNEMMEGFAIHKMIYDQDFVAIDYKYIYVNDTFYEMTGFKEDVIGKTVKELLPNISNDLIQRYSRVVNTGKSKIFNFYDDTLKRHYRIKSFKLEKDVFVTIFDDVTEFVENEKNLIEQRQLAVESDNLKSAFMANMSHEIRTPMNAIMGFSNILQTTYDKLDEKKIKDYLDIIKLSSSRLLNIIDNLLDIAKIESGQYPINNEGFNLKDLLNEINSLYFPHRKIINGQLRMVIEDLNKDFFIFTDKTILFQIFSNLMTNAIKYTEKGQITLKYYIENLEYLVFEVIDTGIGIESEKLDLVFERFRRADEVTNRESNGAGLGLSICKGLVELLNGNISVTSVVNIGSTFTFKIPYISFKNIEVYDKSENMGQDIKDNIIGDVLIVEDNFFSFILLETILEEFKNLNIYHASTGRDAIKIYHDNKIDLVLLDIRLPDISGYEVMKVIRKENPTIPVIAQTANVMSEDIETAKRNGCDGFLKKPVDNLELFLYLKKYLYNF